MKLYKSLISVLFSAVLLLSATNSFAIDKLHFVIGGGAGGGGLNGPGSAGGSGIVIVRGPSSITFGVSPGTNSTSTHPGGDKLATFTVSGTLTIS